MRKKWHEITLPTSGKVTSKQLREFQVNFLACAEDIKDVTPQETRRMLMQKLLPFMSSWVIEAERKLVKENPVVQVQLKDGFREDDIKKAVHAMIGEIPTKVLHLGRGLYRLKFGDLDAAKKMLGMHMRELNGLDKPLLVNMVEQQLSVLDIFELCHDKLTDREHVDSFQANNTERRTRNVRTDPPTHPRSKSASDIGRGANHAPSTPNVHAFVPSSAILPTPPPAPVVPPVTPGTGMFINGKEVIYPFKSQSFSTLTPLHQVGKGGGNSHQNSQSWREGGKGRGGGNGSKGGVSQGKGRGGGGKGSNQGTHNQNGKVPSTQTSPKAGGVAPPLIL